MYYIIATHRHTLYYLCIGGETEVSGDPERKASGPKKMRGEFVTPQVVSLFSVLE